jgi:hypothetical protein
MTNGSPSHANREDQPLNTQLGGIDASNAWRVWITRHPIAAALMSGLIAGGVTTLWGIWFFGIGLPSLNWPEINGGPIDPKGSFITKFLFGGAFSIFDSAILALIFAIFVFPHTGRLVNPLVNLTKSIMFSMALASIAAGFLFPYVYFEGYGIGFGGIHLGGWKFVLAIYLWHFIWGTILGLLYNPLGRSDSRLRYEGKLCLTL